MKSPQHDSHISKHSILDFSTNINVTFFQINILFSSFFSCFQFSMQKSVKFSYVKLKISSFIRKVLDGMAKAKANKIKKNKKRKKIPLIKIMPFVYSTFYFEIGSPLNVFSYFLSFFHEM